MGCYVSLKYFNMRKFGILNLLGVVCVAVSLLLAGCATDDWFGGSGGNDNSLGEIAGTPWVHDELSWVFDMDVLPEVRIEVTEEQWNELLMNYDQNSGTNHYIHCDAEFKSKGEIYDFADAGLRLRGNTSRRRPEGYGGEMHQRNNADWHHCHFTLNLRKFQKDDGHELRNVRKIYLKWHKDDAAYCRELYCYDLFRRYGVWTAPYSSYCRLCIVIFPWTSHGILRLGVKKIGINYFQNNMRCLLWGNKFRLVD